MNQVNAHASESARLMTTFPTRFFPTAQEAMSRSSLETNASSKVFVLPCGAFTWTDGDGLWIHPAYGSRHPLSWLDESDTDEGGPMPTEVAARVTTDDHFSETNFGDWERSDGTEVEST